jgi:hypothetical protein
MSAGQARVELSSHPVWRMRLVRELPRLALLAVSLFGLLASARFAIAPPRPMSANAPLPGPAPVDEAAQGFATLFARRYLTWNAREPIEDEQRLEPFAGSHLEQAAGFVPPPEGAQRVEWVEVVQAREPVSGVHVYTVAAQTSRGLLYLAVSVTRTADGALALAGYPAFVGPPASAPAVVEQRLQDVENPALEVVVRRALTNYLSGSGSDLAADLTDGANVAAPTFPLELLSVAREVWARGGGAVIATIQASDARGARYTLAYEIDVSKAQGRWEISAIETEPNE